MKQSYTKEYMDNNTGCYGLQAGRVEKMYLDSGYKYSDDTILSALEIVNMVVPFNEWMWFFISGCELTQEEFDTLKVDLAKIVLPIYQEKYPDVDIMAELALKIADDDNDSAYNAAQAQLSDKAGSAFMYVAFACIHYKDDTYTNLVKEYLRNFVDNN